MMLARLGAGKGFLGAVHVGLAAANLPFVT